MVSSPSGTSSSSGVTVRVTAPCIAPAGMVRTGGATAAKSAPGEPDNVAVPDDTVNATTAGRARTAPSRVAVSTTVCSLPDSSIAAGEALTRILSDAGSSSTTLTVTSPGSKPW